MDGLGGALIGFGITIQLAIIAYHLSNISAYLKKLAMKINNG